MSLEEPRYYSPLDRILMQIERGLTTLFVDASTTAQRENPAQQIAESSLSDSERKHSGGLMRVNHTGEICAQALYDGQLVMAHAEPVRQTLAIAAAEETDHLVWTSQRLQELGAHQSYLNPWWYTHSFMLGMIAGWIGDRISLAFVEETERQVAQHLAGHLDQLPSNDIKSQTIVTQMREDEQRHGQQAVAAGASTLPAVVKHWMACHAKVMTTIAYWV